MTKTYHVTFTNGIRRNFLAHSPSAARDAAYAWMCYCLPQQVFIAKVEETK